MKPSQIILWILSGVLVVALLGFGIYLLVTQNSSETNTANTAADETSASENVSTGGIALSYSSVEATQGEPRTISLMAVNTSDVELKIASVATNISYPANAKIVFIDSFKPSITNGIWIWATRIDDANGILQIDGSTDKEISFGPGEEVKIAEFSLDSSEPVDLLMSEDLQETIVTEVGTLNNVVDIAGSTITKSF